MAAAEDRVVGGRRSPRLALNDRGRAAEVEVEPQGIEVVVDEEVERLRRSRVADDNGVNEGVPGCGVGVAGDAGLLKGCRFIGLQGWFQHRQRWGTGGDLTGASRLADDDAVGEGDAGLIAGHVGHDGVELDDHRLDLGVDGIEVDDVPQCPRH